VNNSTPIGRITLKCYENILLESVEKIKVTVSVQQLHVQQLHVQQLHVQQLHVQQLHVQQLHVQQPSKYAKPEDGSAVLGSR